MGASPTIFLNFPDEPTSGPRGADSLLETTLPVCGTAVRLLVAAPARSIRLPDMVPLARRLADECVRLARQHVEAEGRRISCRKGCGACCRYLAPLSAPEALRMFEEVRSLPAARRDRTVELLAAAAKAVIGAGPPEVPAAQPHLREDSRKDALRAVGRWYAQIGLCCPFLADEACTIYPTRPLACREHLATSPAEHCCGHQPGRGQLVTFGFSVLEALALLAAELEHAELESIVLPLALEWARVNRDRRAGTWPARTVVARFLAILTEQACRSGRHAPNVRAA